MEGGDGGQPPSYVKGEGGGRDPVENPLFLPPAEMSGLQLLLLDPTAGNCSRLTTTGVTCCCCVSNLAMTPERAPPRLIGSPEQGSSAAAGVPLSPFAQRIM